MRRTFFVALILVLCKADVFAAGEIYMTLDFPGAYDSGISGIFGNVVVGGYSNSSSGPYHGFIYDGNAFTTLDYPGARLTGLSDIDSSGIVGSYVTDRSRGFMYNNGVFTPIDDPLTSSLFGNGCEVQGISGNKVVGGYMDDNAVTHGFVYDGNSYTTLDYPASRSTAALGIDGNNIVGSYSVGSNDHGFLFDGSTWTTIDYPSATSTIPEDILGNLIVGVIYGNSWSGGRGFIYDGANFTLTDEWPSLGAEFIPHGVYGNTLVGQYYKAGRVHGFVTVPEPSSLMAFVVIAAVLCGTMRFSRLCSA